jgi:hypothetical protein
MDSVDLSLIAAYPGKFQKQLLGQLYKELNLQADGIRVIPNVKNSLVLPRLRIGAGLKPYTGKFVSGDNQLKYSDRKLSVDRVQRDLRINPEKYRTTYLVEDIAATSGSNANKPAQVPYAAFMWGEYMKENAQEIVEMLYHGKGVDAFVAYDASATYSAGALIKYTATVDGTTELQYYKCLATTTAGQNPSSTPAKWQWAGNLAITKGFGKIITDAISNEGFSQIASTGTLAQSTIIDQAKSVFRLQFEQVKASGANMYMSISNYEMLLDAMGEKRKYVSEVDDVAYLPESNKKCLIQPVSWLSGSNRLICTPANNLVLGTDQLNDMNALTSIPRHYDIEASLSFLIGTQIGDLDVLTINDQA